MLTKKIHSELSCINLAIKEYRSITLFSIFYFALFLMPFENLKAQTSVEPTQSTIRIGEDIIQMTHFNFQNTTVDNYIRAMEINNQGTITIASRNEIFKFDGSEIFEVIDSGEKRLMEINRISVDRGGNIWTWQYIRNRTEPVQNLSVFEMVSGRHISARKIFGNFSDLISSRIERIKVSPSGEIIINTKSGDLFLVNAIDDIQQIRIENPFFLLGFTPDGSIIGKKQINEKEYSLTELSLNAEIIANYIDLFSETRFEYCNYHAGQLICYDLTDSDFAVWTFHINDDQIRLKNKIQLDKDAELLPNYPGYYKVGDQGRYSFFRWTEEGFMEDSVFSKTLKSLFSTTLPQSLIYDKDIIWIGSITGLTAVQLAPAKFRSALQEGSSPGISTRKIDYLNDSIIQVASYRGLFQLNFHENDELKIKDGKENLIDCAWIYVHTYARSPVRENLFHFGMDHLRTFDKNSGSCQIIYLNQHGVTDVWDITYLWGDYFYIASNTGLFLFDEYERTVQKVEHFRNSDIEKEFRDRVNRINFDPVSKEFYLSTEKGLIHGNIKDNNPLEPKIESILLSGKNVNDLIIFGEDDLFASTWCSGVYRLQRPDYEIIRNFNTNNFLSSNATHNLYADSLNRVWFSANNGLYLLCPEREVIREFNIIDGIHESEFNHLSIAIPENASLPLIYGGINGLVYFYPYQFDVYEKVSISKLQKLELIAGQGVASHSLRFDKLSKNEKIHVGGRYSGLRLIFGSDYLQAQKKLLYRPMDSDLPWKRAGSGGIIPTSSLERGLNRLELMLVLPNNNIIIFDEGLSINLGFTYPKLSTLLLVTLLVIVGSFIFIYLRTKSPSRENTKPEIKEPLSLSKDEEGRQKADNRINEFLNQYDKLDAILTPSKPAEEAAFRASLNEAFSKVTDIKDISSVGDLAKLLSMAERTLHRRVKAAYNITPNKYITIQRLKMARKKMHENNTSTVSEISYLVGYDHVSYFSKLFRDHYGITPSEYKKEYVRIISSREEERE